MYLIFTITAVILNLFLGVLAFKKNPRSATGRFFLILTVILSLWAITNYMSVRTIDPVEVIFWLRPIMVVTGAMFPTIFLLAKSFPSASIGLPKLIILFILIFTLIIQGLALTPLVFERVVVQNSVVTPIPGRAMPFFAMNVLGFLLLTCITLFKKFRSYRGVEKIQLQYLIFGIVVTFILATITNFIFVLVLHNTSFVAIGPLFSLIFVGSIAYAIVKHRFLDIRLVVARTVAYSVLVLIFGIIYGVGLFLAGNVLLGSASSGYQVALSTFLALVMALTFQPLQHLLEGATDQLFFQGRYDSKELLGRISHIMASTFTLTKLSEGLLKELLTQMRISSGFLALTKGESIIWVKGWGKKDHPEFDEKSICALGVAAVNKTQEGILVFDELTENDERKMLRQHNLNIVLPLVAENENIGVILLSDKASGEVYSVEDISLLKIIAPEVAVGVKNALSYEEIKAFNVTLQEEINKATQDLKNANEKLKELDKLKDEFVSLASHELRTPMTAIKGSISTILDGYAGDITKESREFLMAAYSENDRLIRLVNNLLNISRIESGRMTFTVTNFDLKKVIAEVVGNLQMSATDKHLNLKFDADMDLPQVSADEDKVREVLINLIGNAIKFTHEGGVTVKVGIKDGFIEVAVEDTGHGIAPEDKELLFKKFSQVNSYTKQAGGTGLGLYICKQIIESLKGKVWFDSTVGRGSTFYFALPISAV